MTGNGKKNSLWTKNRTIIIIGDDFIVEKIKADKKKLRDFGFIMALAFMVITVIFYLKRQIYLNPAIIASFLFLGAGIFRPQVLKHFYIIWMKLANILSWIMTRVILTIVFFLVLTPLGIIVKLTGRDLLDLKMDKNALSYWTKAEKKEFKKEDYYRQF